MRYVGVQEDAPQLTDDCTLVAYEAPLLAVAPHDTRRLLCPLGGGIEELRAALAAGGEAASAATAVALACPLLSVALAEDEAEVLACAQPQPYSQRAAAKLAALAASVAPGSSAPPGSLHCLLRGRALDTFVGRAGPLQGLWRLQGVWYAAWLVQGGGVGSDALLAYLPGAQADDAVHRVTAIWGGALTRLVGGAVGQLDAPEGVFWLVTWAPGKPPPAADGTSPRLLRVAAFYARRNNLERYLFDSWVPEGRDAKASLGIGAFLPAHPDGAATLIANAANYYDAVSLVVDADGAPCRVEVAQAASTNLINKARAAARESTASRYSRAAPVLTTAASPHYPAPPPRSGGWPTPARWSRRPRSGAGARARRRRWRRW